MYVTPLLQLPPPTPLQTEVLDHRSVVLVDQHPETNTLYLLEVLFRTIQPSKR